MNIKWHIYPHIFLKWQFCPSKVLGFIVGAATLSSSPFALHGCAASLFFSDSHLLHFHHSTQVLIHFQSATLVFSFVGSICLIFCFCDLLVLSYNNGFSACGCHGVAIIMGFLHVGVMLPFIWDAFWGWF